MSALIPQSPFVTTDWLQDHLADPQVRIVDIRGLILPPDQPKPHYFPKVDDYQRSHLPGAVFVDWTRDIVDLDDPIPIQIARPEKFEAFMSSIGVDADTLVIGYDDHRGTLAARLWWALRYYGHEAVRILDGGWDKWIGEGRPVTNLLTMPARTEFRARTTPALRRVASDLGPSADDAAPVLLDARTPDEFAGRLSRARRYGHIPGAQNIPVLELVSGPYGQVRSAEELRSRLAITGVSAAKPVVTYCNGGVSAALLLAAMELVGIHGSLYDGSWGEWGNNPDFPIEI